MIKIEFLKIVLNCSEIYDGPCAAFRFNPNEEPWPDGWIIEYSPGGNKLTINS